MRRTWTVLLALLAVPVLAQEAFEKNLEGMTKVDGLITTYHNEKKNTIKALLKPGDFKQYLTFSAIRTGLGSNDVGLDRGQLGPQYVIEIKRMADKVVFMVPNLGFRANEGSLAEIASVREAFAPSVLWATKIEEEDDEGNVLINLTPFIVRDAHNVKRSVSGNLDLSKSAIDFEECLSFPKNLEFEAMLTYNVGSPNNFVRSTVEIPESWSLVQHITIMELPDDNYVQRKFDPRVGAFNMNYLDYTVPLSESMQKRFAVRHRLSKDGEKSLTYYVDHAAPEPIRSALIEGASWWNEAFKAAGFEFKVEVLQRTFIPWMHDTT